MTQFKEKSRGLTANKRSDESVSSGLFTYPVLQAADILIYRAQYVPVGKDQAQHLELARTLARRFNQRFGTIFPEPQAYFTPTPKIMSLADPGRKMSKSLGPRHYIGLFEEPEIIRAKLQAAVTDSGPTSTSGRISPGVRNLLEILSACGQDNVAKIFRKQYRSGRLRYSDVKGAVADAVIALTSSLRARRQELTEINGDNDLLEVAHDSSRKARHFAVETLHAAREQVGLINAL
jgi:tryptophanyl-tRNA synthetase